MKKIAVFFQDKLALPAIVLAAALARFYQLSGRAIWYDEACSLSFVGRPWELIVSHRYIIKPVYFILLKVWSGIFGPREFAVRSLSVLFGVLSVLLIFKIAKALFDRKAGLLSALFMALSSYQIYYSQEARNYSLFVFLALLSTLILIRMLRKNTPRLFLAYICVNALLIYTHPYGLFNIAAQAIYLVFIQESLEQKKRWVVSLGVIFIFSALLVIALYLDRNNEMNYVARPGAGSLAEVFECFAYGGPRQIHAGVGPMMAASKLLIPRIGACVLFLFCILGLIPGKRPQPEDSAVLRPGSFLALWLFVPIGGSFIISYIFSPMYLTRYFVATAPAFYILAAKGMQRLPAAIYRAALFLLAAFCLFSMNMLFHPGLKGDWRGAAGHLRQNIKDQDIVVFAPINQIVPFWYYYKYENKYPLKDIDREGRLLDGKFSPEFKDNNNHILGIGLFSDGASISKSLSRLPMNKADLWLVISTDWIGRPASGLIQGYLDKSYLLKYKLYYSYNGVTLLRYVHK